MGGLSRFVREPSLRVTSHERRCWVGWVVALGAVLSLAATSHVSAQPPAEESGAEETSESQTSESQASESQTSESQASESQRGGQLDSPVLSTDAQREQLGGAYPWYQAGPVVRQARRADARYVDALAGSWAGAALGAVTGAVMGAGLGALFCSGGDDLACVTGIFGGLTLLSSAGYLFGTVVGVTLGAGEDSWVGFASTGLALLLGGLEALAFGALFAATAEATFLAVGLATSIASVPFMAPLFAVLLRGEEPGGVAVLPVVRPVVGGAVVDLAGEF